jgi:CheY-like chemotaxis protein
MAERGRLLLVEDEFLIRLTLAEALADAGHEVLEAEDADEALAHAGAGEAPIDLLLTDIQLPGPLNGEGLARRIRESHPDLPVIFMTGRPEPGRASGPRDLLIPKPYLPSEVCAAVARLLAT